MTGRSDFGSQSWRYPALLTWASWWQPTRRGTQAEILAALRRLLRREDTTRREAQR